MLPSDDAEINRLDFQHYMLRYALRGNYLAPLTRPRGILDVGSGTGRWAMEMAAQYPEASVVGVDITSPPAEAQSAAGSERRPENSRSCKPISPRDSRLPTVTSILCINACFSWPFPRQAGPP
jgi:tRNA G46 methylase TrmB